MLNGVPLGEVARPRGARRAAATGPCPSARRSAARSLTVTPDPWGSPEVRVRVRALRVAGRSRRRGGRPGPHVEGSLTPAGAAAAATP